jgi:hypothetical protein
METGRMGGLSRSSKSAIRITPFLHSELKEAILYLVLLAHLNGSHFLRGLDMDERVVVGWIR